MSNTDLEDAIRAEFRAQAVHAPEPANLIAQVTAEVRSLGAKRSSSRVRWVWFADAAALAAVLAVVITTALFFRPFGGKEPANPTTAVSPAPTIEACASLAKSSGPAASSAHLAVDANPSQVVSPGENVELSAELAVAKAGPTIYPEQPLEFLALRGGRLLGMLTPSPVGIRAGQALSPGSSTIYGMGYGRFGLALTATAGCPAPSPSTLTAGATYQIVAIVGYRSSALASTPVNYIVSAAADLTLAAPDPANATKTVFLGRMREMGGPAPRQSVPIAGHVRVYRTADTSGTPFAETEAGVDGRFTLTLPPGTYYFTGASAARPDVACVPGNKSIHGDAGSVIGEDMVVLACPYR